MPNDKAKYDFFDKAKAKVDSHLLLPDLCINSAKITRESLLNFLGVMVNGKWTWKTHIQLAESKISKNVGIHFLNLNCL